MCLFSLPLSLPPTTSPFLKFFNVHAAMVGLEFPFLSLCISFWDKVSLSCQGYLAPKMSAVENNVSYFPIKSSWLILFYSLCRFQSFWYIYSNDCRSIVTKTFTYCNRYGINEDLIWLSSICWNGPQRNGNLHKNHLLWERKVPPRAEWGNLSPRKRCHTVLIIGWDWSPDNDGQWWAGAHPDLDCLDVHILSSLGFTSLQDPKDELGSGHGGILLNLFAPLPNVPHTVKLDLLSSLIWLFKLSY